MNCDFLAPWYALLERAAFGRALERCRRCFLAEIRGARHALALGDGDGRALIDLLEACPQVHVDYVDSSARMLEIAGTRVRAAGFADRVAFFHANAVDQIPIKRYDAITTHFFLDCLSEDDIEKLTEQLALNSCPNACWIVSEFRADHTWSRLIVRVLYLFFRVTTGLKQTHLANYRPILERHGFVLKRCQPNSFGLLTAEVFQRERPKSGQDVQTAKKLVSDTNFP